MDPVAIKRPVQLLVEGKDPLNFFGALTGHLGLAGIQVQNYGGINELGGFLKAFVRAPGFASVTDLGVVRDAEGPAGAVEGAPPGEAEVAALRPGTERHADRAFQSLCTALRNAGLPVPARPVERSESSPSVSVLILPGDGDDGMLETLLCRTFADSPVDACIKDFFKCVERSEIPIRRPDKSRARAFLATTPDPQLSVGVAAQRGHWDFDHDAFRGVRRFLRNLVGDTPASKRPVSAEL